METLCHCGRPLHYSIPEIQAQVEDVIAAKGEYVPVRDSKGRYWNVQRHYIALHGIKEHLLDTYGFERLPDRG